MEVLNTLQLIAAFNFLLIGILISLNSKKVTYGVKLLSVFLIAKGITLFTNIVFIKQWPLPISLTMILNSALFLYVPFLYFFARYSVKKQVLHLKKDVVHFLPFIVFLSYNVFRVLFSYSSAFIDNLEIVFYYTQALSYTIAAFLLMQKEKDSSANHRWLKNLLLSFIIVWAMFLSELMFSVFGYLTLAFTAKFLGVLSILILANLTIMIAMYSPDLFFKGWLVIKKTTQENTFVTEGNYQLILNKMLDQELYTNPSFKLADLANAMGFSERNTSLIIKNFHEGNFIDFVNSFRIEAAKQLFIEHQDALTISEVLYEVGFNSKSVFNTLFKKKVGMTPTQFKKTQLGAFSAS